MSFAAPMNDVLIKVIIKAINVVSFILNLNLTIELNFVRDEKRRSGTARTPTDVARGFRLKFSVILCPTEEWMAASLFC